MNRSCRETLGNVFFSSHEKHNLTIWHELRSKNVSFDYEIVCSPDLQGTYLLINLDFFLNFCVNRMQ